MNTANNIFATGYTTTYGCDQQESDQTVSWETIPPDATPMEAELISTVRWKWTTATRILTQGMAPVGTFRDYIDTLPEWQQELLLHTTLVSDAYAVDVALEHGLRAVSNGSEWFQTLRVDSKFGPWRTAGLWNGPRPR